MCQISDHLHKRYKRFIVNIFVVLTMGFPGGSDSKKSAYSAGDLGSIPGLGRSPGEGKGYPLQALDLRAYLNLVHCSAENPVHSPFLIKDTNLDKIT